MILFWCMVLLMFFLLWWIAQWVVLCVYTLACQNTVFWSQFCKFWKTHFVSGTCLYASFKLHKVKSLWNFNFVSTVFVYSLLFLAQLYQFCHFYTRKQFLQLLVTGTDVWLWLPKISLSPKKSFFCLLHHIVGSFKLMHDLLFCAPSPVSKQVSWPSWLYE